METLSYPARHRNCGSRNGRPASRRLVQPEGWRCSSITPSYIDRLVQSVAEKRNSMLRRQ
eukprot:364100-Chlamydomonas_euryale.AAC.54